MGTAAVKWASCFLAIITQMLVIYQKEESGMLGTTWILKLVESFSDEKERGQKKEGGVMGERRVMQSSTWNATCNYPLL